MIIVGMGQNDSPNLLERDFNLGQAGFQLAKGYPGIQKNTGFPPSDYRCISRAAGSEENPFHPGRTSHEIFDFPW